MRALGAVAAVAVGAVPCASAAYRPQLVVTGSQVVFAQPADDDATARIEIAVPPAYAFSNGGAPGAVIGTATGRVTVRGFDVGHISLPGRVIVGRPEDYAAAAAACAARGVEGVWLIELSAQGRTFAFPVFVGQAGGGAHLVVCFPSPYVPEFEGGAPFGVKLVGAVLTLPGVLGKPSGAARLVWSGLFTPYVPRTADPGTSVEARAVVPVPQTLTLRARRVRAPAGGVVLLRGRLTEVRAHPVGVRVELYAGAGSGAGQRVRVARTRTRRGGYFSFRRPLKRTSYRAVVPARRSKRDCRRTTAPGGCVSAVVSPAESRLVRVVLRR